LYGFVRDVDAIHRGHVVVVRFFNSHRLFWHRGDFVSSQLRSDVLPLWCFFLAKSCVDKEARACGVNEACAACEKENEECDVNAGARM
jgi:hypothetical protein